MQVLLDPDAHRDLAADLLDEHSRLRCVPSQYFDSTTAEERCLFGVRHARYGFVTQQLVEWLARLIGPDRHETIEIGAGAGDLAWHLGVRATDSMIQSDESVARAYAMLQQPPVRYGANVEKLDALQAVKLLRPRTVLAMWVTHRWDAARPEAGGFEHGVDEQQVIEGCEQYVFIGNERVHRTKPIWARPHAIVRPAWLHSRAINGSANFIAVWRRDARVPDLRGLLAGSAAGGAEQTATCGQSRPTRQEA